MVAEQVALLADHLRLHPQAEVKAQSLHVFAQAAQAAGQLAGVLLPVAQGGGVVLTAPEPAVIQHQQLRAQGLGLLAQGQQLAAVYFEIHGLPAVHQHGALPVLPLAANDVAADEAVHLHAHAAEAGDGEHADGLGRVEALAGAQAPCEAVHALDDADAAVWPLLHHAKMIAAVQKVEAPHGAEALGGVGSGHHGKGVAPAGADPHPGAPGLAAGNGSGDMIHLPGPGTPEGVEEIVTPGKVDLLAHQAADGDGAVGIVAEPGPADDGVRLGENGIVEIEIHLMADVLAHHLQRLPLPCRGGQAGRDIQLRAHGVEVAEGGAAVAVGENDVYGALPAVAPAGSAHLLVHPLQGGAAFQHHGVAGLMAVDRGQGLIVLPPAQTGAVVEVLQHAVLPGTEAVGSALGLQNKEAILNGDHGKSSLVIILILIIVYTAEKWYGDFTFFAKKAARRRSGAARAAIGKRRAGRNTEEASRYGKE